MKAAVVGLGKIGLPLAVQIAGRGIPTVGADISPDVVASVGAGVPPFPGEPGLEEGLAAQIANGSLRATTSTAEAVQDATVVVVVVPLMVYRSGTPTFEGIDGATAAIGGALRRGQLVVYETTLPVGTTRDRFGPQLEESSGMRVGTDFYLAFSPERVSSGSVFRDLRRYPKLVGGVDEASTCAAIAFYERALEFDARPDLDRPNGVWEMASTEAAELAKLAETTYRDVNIALANEFATYSEALGLDGRAVIAAANSQPYSHIHRPGVAVGGHCIPVYPRFYLAGHTDAVLPAAARSVNEAQPERVVARLEDLAGPLVDQKVVVLGAAYRGGVKETAFSGVFGVVEAVAKRGGISVVHDPLFDDDELVDLGLEPHRMGDRADAAILQADHADYLDLRPADIPGCRVMVDGRGVLDETVWATDVTFAAVGIG